MLNSKDPMLVKSHVHLLIIGDLTTGSMEKCRYNVFNGTITIQGDGWKYLGHFKCHFGSQISSESLKLGHILRMKPRFVTK